MRRVDLSRSSAKIKKSAAEADNQTPLRILRLALHTRPATACCECCFVGQ